MLAADAPGNAPPAQQTTTRKVLLKDIMRVPEYQVRARVKPSWVNTLATKYKGDHDVDPIQLAQVKGSLLLIDGWHRLTALQQLNRREVLAVITTTDEAGARWMAARANLKHGLPLEKKQEKRNVFNAYMKARQYWKSPKHLKSYAEITADLECAVDRSTVYRWMRKSYPEIAAMMSKGDDDTPSFDGEQAGRHDDGPAVARVRQHLQDARAAFRDVYDHRTRKQLLREVKDVLDAMRDKDATTEEKTGESLDYFAEVNPVDPSIF